MKRKKIDSFTLFVILLLALILTLLGMLLAGMKEEKRQDVYKRQAVYESGDCRV